MKLRAVCLLLLMGFAGDAVRAQQVEPPRFVGIRVGFADQYKVGLWTPVELTLRGGTQAMTGRVSVTTQDSDGVPYGVTMPEGACQVLPGQETTVMLYVRFGGVSESLEAEFRVDGRAVASREFESGVGADDLHFGDALHSQGLIVQVGRAPLGLEDALAIDKFRGEPRSVVARIDDPSRLPTHWYGYEGVDVVVLSTSRPEIYRKLTPDGARIQALDQWVRLGGKLILLVGSQGDQVLHPGTPLARFAPGRFDRMVSLRQTGALETYAKSSTAVPKPEGGQKTEIRIPRLSGVTGRIEAHEADLPLVVRSPRGFGHVVFVAADLDRAPMNNWSDRKLLAAKLLDVSATPQPEEEDTNRGHYYGFSDLTGQLRSAMDEFSGVHMVPFSVVAFLVVIYLLLIGPGDYFFLRKFVRRMEWTWVTFPVIVAIFCVGAYVAAYRLKGDQLRVNQVDLVDVDAAGIVRGTTWFNVFSPQRDTFTLSLAPQLPDGQTPDGAESVMAWLGLPGDGIGGMRRGRSSGSMLWSGQYAFSPALDSMRDVPIQVWSTKSFTGRWSSPVTAATVQASLVDEDRVPVGTVTNRLAFRLSECILAYDRWAYDLGSLDPGQAAELGTATRRTELRTLLTGRRLAFDAQQSMKQETTPYDQTTRDAAYILQAMMFFEAAGGRHYTGLGNDYQRFVDLSGLLRAGRAILVARPSTPEDHRGAQVLRDGQPMGRPDDMHTTVYRFVLPVTAKE